MAWHWGALVGVGLALAGCASIPAEAPELSAQLGNRISAVEAAHLRLLEDFFVEKRRRVDQYVDDVWMPVFAQEFFADARVETLWDQVVQSRDPRDRVRFLTLVGPRLQAQINRKRAELVQPLDELESTVRARLRAEYDSMRALNNSLTTFLRSASKVDENRRRYLEMAGISAQETDRFAADTDAAVAELVSSAQNAENRLQEVEKFRAQIRGVIDKVRK